jgi:hypothetical protein
MPNVTYVEWAEIVRTVDTDTAAMPDKVFSNGAILHKEHSRPTIAPSENRRDMLNIDGSSYGTVKQQ